MPEIRSKLVKKEQKTSDIQMMPPSNGMMVLYFMYTLLQMVILGGFSIFKRTLCDNIRNYNFILIHANIFFLVICRIGWPKSK